jgi:hypothetical protein
MIWNVDEGDVDCERNSNSRRSHVSTSSSIGFKFSLAACPSKLHDFVGKLLKEEQNTRGWSFDLDGWQI